MMIKEQLASLLPRPAGPRGSASVVAGSPVPRDLGSHRDARALPLLPMCGLALVVGVVTGLGAVLFRALIACVHNMLFLGQFSFVYDSNLFTPPSPWGAWVIL